MRIVDECLFQVYRDGVLFRSFAGKNKALDYIAVAVELCPDHTWDFRVKVFAPC